MTIKELLSATAELGFEPTLESADRFFAAANRALYCANRIRPKTGEAELSITEEWGSCPDKEIEGRKYRIYDITKSENEFMCYTPTPVIYGTRPLVENSDYILWTDNRILLPCDMTGAYRIQFYKTLKKITPDDENAKIDLDEDVCQILPLLVASYVWLEDEPEKASLYKNLFYSEASEIKSFTRKRNGTLYSIEAGWSD